MQRYGLSGYPPNVFKIIFENSDIIDVNQGLEAKKGLYRRDRLDRQNRRDRLDRGMGIMGMRESRMGRRHNGQGKHEGQEWLNKHIKGSARGHIWPPFGLTIIWRRLHV